MEILNVKLVVRIECICFIQFSFRDGQNVEFFVYKLVFDFVEFKVGYIVGIDLIDFNVFLMYFNLSVKICLIVVVVFVFIQSLFVVIVRIVVGINFINVSKRQFYFV